MREILLNFPKQFKTGLERAKDVKASGDFERIVICGMGGSALPGTLLMDCLPDIKIPIYTHRSYDLPPQADEKSLIFSISFSGNTEETLSGYQEAIKRNIKTVAITTNGKLKELAEENNLPVVVVPNDCLEPRFGTGYLLSALFTVLSNSGIIKDKSKELLDLAQNLNPTAFEEQGKQLAKKLIKKIPVVYSSARLKSLARIWKIKFNEHAKTMAFWNYFPELNHNEMAGFTRIEDYASEAKSFHVVILQTQNEHPQVLKRMEITADLIKEAGAGIDIIKIEGKNTLETIFNALILGDWATYYLALEYNQDPIPVKIVAEFKKRLTG